MPIYQYRNLHTGKLEDHWRTVAQRDAVPPGLVRITVPQRVGIFGTSSDPIDEQSAEYEVPRAYRQLEAKMPAREILKEGGFSVDQVREAWRM